MNLKPYYDAVQTAEARVREIAGRMDDLFTQEKTDEAMKILPDLDKARAQADNANKLYLSMRGASGEGTAPAGGDPGRLFVPGRADQDLQIGMSNQEIRKYSLIRAINAAAEAHTNPRAWDNAGLELDASRAMAEKLGRTPQGFFVPFDIQQAPVHPVKGRRVVDTNMAGDPALGGYTIATELASASFVDLLRNKMVLRTAGAVTLTGLVGNLDIPTKTAGARAYWIGEGNAPTKSTLGFGQIAVRPRTVAAYLEFTRRMLQQSSIDVEMLARDDLAESLALESDFVGIHGLGSENQPLGVLNAGIEIVEGGTNGAAPTWAHMVGLESKVAVANADIGRTAYITNALVRGKLKQTTKVTNQNGFIWENNQVNGYDAYATNQIRSDLVKGNASTCSAMIFGNWADLTFAYWGGLDLIVDPYSNSTSGKVLITAMQDVDTVIRRKASFAAMVDILTA